MNEHILSAIRSQPWAIMPGYLEAIEALALRTIEHPAVRQVAEDGHVERHADAMAQMGARAPGTITATIRDGVGALPMFGPILPRAAMITPSGGGAVALDRMAADLRTLQADADVKRILLVVDSPGGAVTQVAEMARLVASSEKPIAAHVTGMCCSAAYWIVSQSSEISLDATGLVGSIGVMMGGSAQEGPDAQGRRQIDIVSSGAPNKRPDLSTDEGRAQVREMLDALEESFIQAVARGRGVTEATVRADFGQGGTKVGKHAKEAGMVDRIEAEGLDASLRRLATRAPQNARRRASAENALALTRARSGL